MPSAATSTARTLSADAYNKFIEDDFLGGQRLNPRTDGRPDSRLDTRENKHALGNLVRDFNFHQKPRAPVIAPRLPRNRPRAKTALLNMPLQESRPAKDGGSTAYTALQCPLKSWCWSILASASWPARYARGLTRGG